MAYFLLLIACHFNGADLADHNPSLHRRVLDRPGDCIPPFCEALEDYIRNQAPKVVEGERGGGGGGVVVATRCRSEISACVCRVDYTRHLTLVAIVTQCSLIPLSCSSWRRDSACTLASAGSLGRTQSPRAN